MKKEKRKWKTRKQRGGDKDIVNDYKLLLARYTYSDAKHDFDKGQKPTFYSQYKHEIKVGIPTSSYNDTSIEYSEKHLLDSIKIISINDKPNTDKINITPFFI